MHFDLVDLRLFLHVAEAGSITAGAEQAGLSLASASARVTGRRVAAGARPPRRRADAGGPDAVTSRAAGDRSDGADARRGWRVRPRAERTRAVARQHRGCGGERAYGCAGWMQAAAWSRLARRATHATAPS